MLQFTDPERVVYKEDSGKDGFISQGKEIRIDIIDRLGIDRVEIKRNQVGEDGEKEFWKKKQLKLGSSWVVQHRKLLPVSI